MNHLIQIFRLILAAGIFGWAVWFLGGVVIRGIQTGAIRHTDSTRMCRRDKNPAGFWALVILFCAFIAGIGYAFGFAVVDVVFQRGSD